MSSTGQPTVPRRLDSWKEIAAFLGRAERTVKRWEAERGMPVHRVPGSERGAVFAYDEELHEWLRGSQPAVESDDSSDQNSSQAPGIPSLISPAPTPTDESVRTSGWGAYGWGRLAAWAIPLVLLGTVLALTFGHRGVTFEKAAAGAHEPNPEARDLYLQGRYYWNRRTPADLNQAVDSFTQAIVKDPTYAPAYIGLADCYNLLREFGAMPAKEAFPRALAAAQRAVALDPSSAEAHTSLAFATFYWSWDGISAERDFKRAIELDPNFARAHHWYATSLAALARFPEALDQLEQARSLDPSSTALLADKGWILYLSGKTDEAVALLKRVAANEPSFSATHGYLSGIAYDQGDYPTFFSERKLYANLRNDEAAMAVAQAAESGFTTGGEQRMREAMLEAEKLYFQRDAVSAFDVAKTCALLGRKEEALHYFQDAFNHRDVELLAYRSDVTFNRTFAGLRGDPKFQHIIASVSQHLPN
jgi:tetratricopeptide (TPR) repeat protein